jgi:DNA primase
MRFPPSLLDEIRARLPVSQVVGRHVKLKRAGREFIGLSPFKNEKSPSFTVNDQKGFYHCFASGEHGDIFKFLMSAEGLSFPEAVERLANEAGVEMPKTTPQAEAREEQSVRLVRLVEAATAFYQESLRSSAGRQARDYLDQRGLDTGDIAQFRLGYAPAGRHNLKEHLLARGFSQDDMITSGMLIAGADIPVSYDRFRHRLMFPITNLRGVVIAFGGRALDAEQQPKYLNSPETPLFHKGSTLYNAAAARKAAHDRNAIIVAEGYMDVIALTRAGFPNAVAPLGTALTSDQLKLLWRMTNEPTLCFDGDSAGQKAAFRAVEMALPQLLPGKSLQFTFLPEGLDPDDMLRLFGAEGVAAALSKTRPLVDVLWSKEFLAANVDTPEQRAAFEKRLDELVATITDSTVRFHYLQELRSRHRELTWSRPDHAKGATRRETGYQGRQGPRKGGSFPNANRRSAFAPAATLGATTSLMESALVQAAPARLPAREALILQTILNHPWLLDDFAEDIAAVQFEANPHHRLRDLILSIHSEQNPLDKDTLHKQLNVLGQETLLTQVEHAITHNSDWNTQPRTSREDVLIGWRHMLALHRKSVELKRELETAERAFALEQSEENYLRVRDLRGQVLDYDVHSAGEGYVKNAGL